MNESAIADLPDYPALVRLASALWNDRHARGAAVLVGAGFSRNAERAGHDTKLPPLWSDLRQGMAKALYQERFDDAPQDALRLAEEYRAYLGQAALIEFIREQVPDASWRPGRLHQELMALPWADVLTTNYDTLLERASDRHTVVRDAADLAQVRGARVIKLHGSIDGNARLVIAEEDYRTYPARSAAFVNTARQIFLENELCLIGFSGDDPNFLQWSGWVRDHLGDSARRIYLVGSLGLNPAKRRLLESRNVTPIDFAPLTLGLQRAEAENRACELFLSYLASRKPGRAIDWRPAQSESYPFIQADPQIMRQQMENPTSAEALLKQLAEVWQVDQDTCPDWLVLPKRKRQEVIFGTAKSPWNYVKALPSINPELRARLLRQVVWRHSVTLEPLAEDLEAQVAALASEDNDLPRECRLALLRALLSEARYNRNQSRFEKVAVRLEALTSPGSDARADLVAQRLLWARDGLDYAAMSSGIEALEGPDPKWRLLRAALHCECGDTELAKSLITAASADLADRGRRDPLSTSVFSRRAWAAIFERAFRIFETWAWDYDAPGGNLTAGYDVEDEIDLLRHEVRSARLRQMEEPEGYQPGFGPGTYKDHGSTIRFRSAPLGHEGETIFRLADTACLPLRVGNVDILASLAGDALNNEPLPSLGWHLRLLRAIPSGSSSALRSNFDSAAIALLDPEVATELTERLFTVVRFWHSRVGSSDRGRTVAVQKLEVFLEVLARLIVRSKPSAARDAFRLGVDIASDPLKMHHFLYEPTANLLKWSLAALPPEDHGELVIDSLDFPLPANTPPATFHWPEPAGELFSRGTLPNRPVGDTRWRACIAKLLEAVSKSGPARTRAVLRLAYLTVHKCLESSELEDFGRLLWSSQNPEKGGLPCDVELFPHVIAALPGTEGVIPADVIRAYLFQAPLVSSDSQERLECIASAAHSWGAIASMLPSHNEAIELLDGIGALVAKLPEVGDPFSVQAKKRFLKSAGRAIGEAILPQLEAEDLTASRFELIKLCASLGNGGGLLAGWHEIARISPSLISTVSADLRRAIARGDLHDIGGASRSIQGWAEAARAGRCPPLPELLKEAVIAALEVGVGQGLQARLWCARRLMQSNMFSTSQIEALSVVITNLQDDLTYEKMPRSGPEAVGVTAARAECVRLADALVAAGYETAAWTADVDTDPLPEVRFSRLNSN
jgi:hypothetical protein